MVVREITENYRLDKLIASEYGVYNEYFKSAVCFFNPKVDLLQLKVGTKLLMPTRAEISALGRVRGYYDLVRD